MDEKEPVQFVSLQAAMEQMGVSDQPQFIRTAKRHACYLKKSGIVRINLTELQRRVDEEFAMAQAQLAKGKAIKRNVGSDFGLVSARISQFEKRNKAKLEKISVLKEALAKATNNHERGKLQRDLTKAEGELKKLKDGYERDIKRRDEILNGPDTSESESAN